jgi:FkbM family methyltransferase
MLGQLVHAAKRTRSKIFLILASALTLASVGLAISNSLLRAALDAESCPPSKFEGANYFGQTYEDYVLAYVFAQAARGTYIDVGANHPIRSNVSAYFYALGWRGITIEPNPDFAPLYARLRPLDTHLSIGVGDIDGKMTFHRVFGPHGRDSSGFSTFDDDEAAKLVRTGYRVEDVLVEVATLNHVLERHPLPAISFLSIDVEGFEKKVLQGIDLQIHKPTVIVLEAETPRTEIPSYLQWEGILHRAGYVFAMFDGLNRYYVHRERVDLLPRFVHVDMCVMKSKLARKIKLDGWTPY